MVKELADAFTSVCGPARACCRCRGGGRPLPSRRGPLRGQRVERQPLFLDETAAATNMAQRYSWARRGERCRLAAPQGREKTNTITAALRTSGLYASALCDGPTNGTRFRSYVTETLIPVLHLGD